jgi:hypothetical protein
MCLFQGRCEAGFEEVPALYGKHILVGGKVAAAVEDVLEDWLGETGQTYGVASLRSFLEVAPGGAEDLDAVQP